MTAATEGCVDARTGAVQAEAETNIAKALLSVERSNISQTRWILGVMVGLFTAYAAIAVSIALAVTNR